MKVNLDKLRKYKIGVLAGGFSSERDISLKSGKAVFDALLSGGLDAVFIDIKKPSLDGVDIDAAFIALHGKFGEDGTVQKMLADRRIPYTGSGPEASRVALDKVESKNKFKAAGLRVADHVVLRKGSKRDEDGLWFPCVVKPRYEGSSVGLSVVKDRKDLEKAVGEAFLYGEDILIEKFIPGKELTVGILEERPLPVVEIVAAGGVYDFVAKYKAGDTRYIVPAELDEDTYRRAQNAGIKAHEALGCRGLSRVDMRLGDDGELYVLEVNTIPGMTERSLLPMAARAAGLDFTELCFRIIESAVSAGTNVVKV